MKVSVNWLREYTDIDLSVDELVQKIGAQLGAVEEVISLGERYKGIVVAKVLECEKHPNADKLKVCQIDTGKKKVQVVCGAPNVKAGMLVAWIPPGNTVPATFDKDPFVLEAREIRGQMSNGMLASGHELAINEDHSGIIEIEEDIKPGEPLANVLDLNDYILDIENKMFTHRPDCFGILGVAREIAGISGKKFVSPPWYLKPGTQTPKANTNLSLKVINEIPELAPRFMAVAMSDVNVGPSPLRVQSFLSRVGIKPINNIVDITNYMMHLTGQPLHAYDYDKVKSLSTSTPALIVRKPHKGEKLTVLGGKELAPHTEAIIIATDKKLIGIGGVIGGADTEVDASTKNIILECANFNMYSVRRTSMQHGLFTDAVTRFTKNQSREQNDRVIAETAFIISQLSGGRVASDIIDKHKPTEASSVSIKPEFINDRLGLELKAGEITKLLENVEFKVTGTDKLSVAAPFWRTDIHIPEDVVEEVGRLYGYDHLPLVLPSRSITPTNPDNELQTKQALRSGLSALGANEVLTYSFAHGDLLRKAGQDPKEAFKITNALSPDLQYYRLSLTPSLLALVHPNIKAGHGKFALFEIGKVHGKSEVDKDKLPKEFGRVSLVFADKNKNPKAPYYRVLPFLAPLYERFGGIKFAALKDSKIKGHKLFDQMTAPFDADRSALIYNHDELVGITGEYKASVIKSFKLPAQTAGFELFLRPFVKNPPTPSYSQLSRYPTISQDLCLRTSPSVDFGTLLEALEVSIRRNAPEDVVTSTECIDIFAKDKAHKQTTFRVSAFSYDRTLTTDLISGILDKSSKEIKEKHGASRV